MVRAILFDLDGTLINSLEDLADSANYALSQRGYPTHDVEAYRYFVGNGITKLIERVLPKERASEVEIKNLKEIFEEYYQAHSLDKTRPYDTVPNLLLELKRQSIKTAIVSNKPDDQTQYTVSKLFDSGTFDYITGNPEDFPLKPNPLLTTHVLEALGIPPADCFFVGDTAVDMQTAKKAGCQAIGVTWGFREKDELLRSGADHLIDKPMELISLLSDQLF